MPNGKGERPRIYSFNLRRELGATEDPRPTDEIAADIVKKYGENRAVLEKLATMGTDLDRFNTPEDIEPFLRGQSLIGTTPEVYLALARKWQALRKKADAGIAIGIREQAQEHRDRVQGLVGSARSLIKFIDFVKLNQNLIPTAEESKNARDVAAGSSRKELEGALEYNQRGNETTDLSSEDIARLEATAAEYIKRFGES